MSRYVTLCPQFFIFLEAPHVLTQCSCPLEAGQDRTGPNRTGQGWTGQDRTGPDRTGQDRAGQDRTGPDRTGQGRTGQDAEISGKCLRFVECVCVCVCVCVIEREKQFHFCFCCVYI